MTRVELIESLTQDVINCENLIFGDNRIINEYFNTPKPTRKQQNVFDQTNIDRYTRIAVKDKCKDIIVQLTNLDF